MIFVSDIFLQLMNKYFNLLFKYFFFLFYPTDCCLNWWTTLLNLLYDDSAEIRRNAAETVRRLPPETELMSHVIMTDTFFMKFTSEVGRKLEALVAAFSCWSIKSAAVVLEEMDEADVRKLYIYIRINAVLKAMNQKLTQTYILSRCSTRAVTTRHSNRCKSRITASNI